MTDLREGRTGTLPNGTRVIVQGGQIVPLDRPGEPLTKGSENRARVELGLGPAVEAQKNMYASEGWKPGASNPLGSNPYDRHWMASNIALSADHGKPDYQVPFTPVGIDKQWLAKKVGGQDYQNYDQASKSWESSMLPILSGAAITPSEAQRQIRARLPQLGDSPQTLARKAKERAMMTNAAADLVGKPRPFTRVGTWDFGRAPSGQSQASGQVKAPSGGAANVIRYDAKGNRIP